MPRAAVPLVLASLFWSLSARAELYTYTDADGVIHFTNIPRGRRIKEPRLLGRDGNTYEWDDDRGEKRRLHRVEVDTYDDLIVAAARYYSLPAALVKAVVAAESAFEPQAVSPKGARGLMQLIDATAAEMHVQDPFDPRDNIYGGTRYLRILANRFHGELTLTLAAYNAGPVAVERARGVPPFAETRTYVSRVLELYKHYLASPPGGGKSEPR